MHREIFFANQWKIFRYPVDLYDLKKYSIGNELPYAPEIDVHRIDKRTGQRVGSTGRGSAFGSFTAIERGGGGFALMDGRWGGPTEWKQDLIKGEASRKNRVATSLVSKAYAPLVGPKAGLESRVRLESRGRPSKEGATDKGAAWVNGLAFFSYPDGGKLTLNIEFQPDFVGCSTCEHQAFVKNAYLTKD